MIKHILVATIVAATLGISAQAAELGPQNLHRYSANHYAWNTNSYWIEGNDGIALIDAQLLPSDAKRLAAQIKATGKPLAGVIITHPHLDHFGGLPALRDEFGDFPIYATQVSADAFTATHQQMLKSNPMPNSFGEAVDERFILPTNLVTDGDTVSIAGIDFEIHDLGAGEATDNLIAYQKDLDVVFAGDTFYPYTHYYIGEGHIDGVLSHLNYLKENFAADTFVLPGHNDASRITSVDAQINYVTQVVAFTEKALSVAENREENGYLKRPARAQVAKELMEQFPGYEDFNFGAATILRWNIFGVESYLIAKSK